MILFFQQINWKRDREREGCRERERDREKVRVREREGKSDKTIENVAIANVKYHRNIRDDLYE